MALLNLPLELLHRVIEETIPEDFENFALSCKSVYRTSDIVRGRYNELRRSYRAFAITCAEGESEEPLETGFSQVGPVVTSIQLLHRIAKEPIIARYIQHLDLTHDSPPESDSVLQEEINGDLDGKGWAKGVRHLLHDSPYLQAAGLDPEEWFSEVMGKLTRWDTSEHAALFLLTLVPNLEVLALPQSWDAFANPVYERMSDDVRGKTSRLWSLLDVIVKEANDPNNPQAALAKLTTLRPMAGTGYDARCGLQTMVPFLSINSVREMYAGALIAIDDSYTGKPFDPRYDSFGANLERVEMAGCCVNATELKKFLSRTKKLKIFKFSYETKWHGCGHNWDAGAFMAALEEAMCGQLEELSITILNCYGHTGTALTSMKKFQILKEIELDVRLLLGPPHRGNGDCFELDTPDNNDEEPQVPTLGDLLPPSVERFCLITDLFDANIDVVCKLFEDFVTNKEEKIPNLSHIQVRYGTKHSGPSPSQGPNLKKKDPRWKGMFKAFDAVEKGELCKMPGKALARWMEDFYDRFDVESQ